ncbi:hypothetical protein N7475_009390 [Penicillium sp. IBT 31633x]|nr:hypothetical protein N7475_009390 [Penicillium sp. IBT 31633x]
MTHQVALLLHQSAGSIELGRGGLGLEFWDAMELPISERAIIGVVMSDRQANASRLVLTGTNPRDERYWTGVAG